jgi:hypothetical protein
MYRKPLVGFLPALIILFFTAHPVLLQSQLEVTVTTQTKNYHYRQLVNVYGNVTYNDELVSNGLVALQITFPHSLEGFNVTRTVPANATPTENWKIEIASFSSTNSEGDPQTIFSKGGDAWFQVTIQNNEDFGDETILYTLTLCDSDSTPFKFHWVRTTIPAGGNFNELVRIDLNAYNGGTWVSTGIAKAYANVYTTWPSMGGSPYSPEKSAAFTITSSSLQTIATAPSPTIPAQTASNYNSYQASIRLPPAIPLGTYTITASAYYRGSTHSWTTTTFDREYELKGDIIYNRRIDIFDVVAVASAYGTKGGVPNWNPEADLDANGKVDIFDVVTVAGNYGVVY